MNNNVIYAYKNIIEDKIVYVGQTVNLKIRHYNHIKIDPYKKYKKEYEYPLSRGIRKYGEKNYELIILESNIKKDNLDDREIYWIEYYNTYYNGYNQNKGGSRADRYYSVDDDMFMKIVDLLKNTNYSLTYISEITGVSMTHIYII